MLLCELLEGIAYRLGEDSAPLAQREVERIVTAPTGANAGALYICTERVIEGTRDGMAAYAAGCRLLLCGHDAYPGAGCVILIAPKPDELAGLLTARLLGFPARRMTVFGVSGMVGKTSVALMLQGILTHAKIPVSSLTSMGFYCNGRLRAPAARVPDAVEIQYALQEMAEAGSEVAILEFSAYQLAHFAAKSIPFAALLITNQDFDTSCEDFDRSCARKRAAYPLLLQEQAAFAVLPADLPYAGRARVLALGKGGAAEVLECRVVQPLVGKCFLSCTIALLGERVSFSLQSVASFHAENAAAAGLLARIAGVSAKEIAAALEDFCVPGRACCVSDASAPPVLTDSGYLPSHLEKLLRTLRPLTTGRLCVLLGSVGGRAYARRAALGRVAATYADFVYLTADDPDTEDVCAICAQMQEGIAERERTLVIPQREAAIRRAVCELRPGDVLLLFGKGGLDFQLIGGERAPLDEPGEVLAALSYL